MHPHLMHQLAIERERDLIAHTNRARAPRRRLGRRTLLAIALPVALAAVALPSAAQAASVSGGQGNLAVLDRSFFVGGSIEANDVTVRVAGSSLIVTDSAGITTEHQGSGGTCVRVSAVEANCPLSGISEVQMNLAGGDDRLHYRAFHGGGAELGEGRNSVIAGTREATGRTIQPFAYRGSSSASDTINYAAASSGVSVDMADNLASDGRPGVDRENVIGFETLFGSQFRDTLFGTPNRDTIAGLDERDIIAGGASDDSFYSGAKDGADDYHGGPGRDTILYIGRTQPLKVTLDNIANDGETNEADNVRTNVENVTGGSGDDRITSFGTFSRLEGLGGADTLTSGAGPDTLIGGAGRDAMEAGGGNDVVDARDGEADFVDCGTEADTVSRDIGEGIIRGCETVNVGVLRLAAKTIDAEAATPATVKLSWRHPEGWRKLRSITLRLTHDGVAAGEITIRPRGKRIKTDGVATVVRRATRLTRRGKTVTARLALRIDRSMAGEKLGLEVEAIDTRGRRQLETNAGTLRVK